MSSRIELVLSVILVVVASRYLFHFIHTMAASSLWLDELYTVIHYSSRGPGHVLTTYGEANNHIFFNLINALTPGAGSIAPGRARLWSFVAVIAMQGCVLWEFFRRGWYLVGAVLFYLFAVNFAWLDLTLQARGYSILGLCALVSGLAVWRYLEHPRDRWLFLLGAATVIGTWSVPTFVGFAGALWLAVLVAVRRRRVFWFGMATLGAIVATYVPVATQVRAEMSGYKAQWGRHYTGIDDVYGTLRSFLLSKQVVGITIAGGLVVLLVVAALVASWLLPIDRTVRLLVSVLVGATAAFFVASTRLGTILPRATAFAVVPLALALAAFAGSVLAFPKLALVRVGVAAIVVGGLSLHTIALGRDFAFVPIEDWKSASGYIEHTFPYNTSVASTDTRFASLGAPYLDERFPVRTAPNALNPFALALGKTVVVDFSRSAAPHHDLGVPGVISEVRVPQRRGRYVRLLAVPPRNARVDKVTVDGETRALRPLTDHRASTGTRIATRTSSTIRVVPSRGVSRSAVMKFDGPTPDVRVIEVQLADGSTERVAPAHVTGAGVVTIPLGDREVNRVDVTLDRTRSDEPRRLAEVWTYPTRW